MFNAEKFCKDFGISFATSHKNVSSGWIGLNCPFCSDQNYHLGFNLNGEYFYCWKCRGHSIENTIKQFLNVDFSQAVKLKEQYQTFYRNPFVHEKYKRAVASCYLPPQSNSLKTVHKKYLSDRLYDPDKLERIWELKGTMHFSPVSYWENDVKKEMDFSYRIIAPINFNSRLVSYQSRTTQKLSFTPYKACPKSLEVINIKKVLYGWDLVPATDVVVVEGIADAWRLGPGALCVFGVSYTREQVMLLAKFRRVFIMFDNDKPGKTQAESLQRDLNKIMTGVRIIDIDGVKDPGELKQSEADHLMREMGIRIK
jgi:hypothetical protein